MNDYLNVLLASIGSLTTMFILVKLLGNRQMSQLSMFDYINGITLGSIAGEMATSLENDFLKPLIAMIIYTLAILLFSIVSSKSLVLRKFITGKSIVLMQNGKLIETNFRKGKLDVNEFITQCRLNGYFNIADLQSAILETNGNISFLPYSTKRPITPEDMNITPPDVKPVLNIIIDGQIIEENLKATGNNKTWLDNELKKQKFKKLDEIFLATCDIDNNLSIYIKNKKDN